MRTKLWLEAAIKMGKVSKIVKGYHHVLHSAARRGVKKEYLAPQMSQVCGVVLHPVPQIS